MCEYCNESNTEVYLEGSDGIVKYINRNRYYIFAEHYRGEFIRIFDIKYCPKCGSKLEV